MAKTYLLLLALLWPLHSFSLDRDQPDLRSRIVQTALAEVGQHEVGGNNRGPAVAKYCGAVGQRDGIPWCACFVKWVFAQHKISTTGANAWSPSWFPSARVFYRRGQRETQLPQPGDVGGLFYQNLGRIGHVFIFVKWGKNAVETVEGNTNDQGARDSMTGDAVHRKRRLPRQIFIASNWLPS